ncbi:MAG: hypothetical protein C4576_31675 [Desulfobacteraceae bacterium]|nr:MAG: hypothetical protein C4576_31675 [Desulfobacteraceae bacterium]
MRRSIVIDLFLLAAIEAFMMVFLDVRYLFYDTVVTGGDTASWHGIAHHLLTELIPNGRLTGWDMGNFCGYPNFSFYFLPPFLLAVLPSYLFGLPLTITLKLAIASGIFLFPVMVWLGLRKMGYRFPGPIIGAAGSLLLLFNEFYTMFGGNVLSTNAGEFSYMFAFALFAWFIGTIYRGVEKEEGWIGNGLLLGLIGLCHLFVFVPAVCLMIYLFLARGRLGYLIKVSILGFGIMAFWILPILAYRHPWTTPVYMIWQEFVSWRHTFMGIGIILLVIGPRTALAALGEIGDTSSAGYRTWAFFVLAGLAAFTVLYVGGTFLVRGSGLFDQGLTVTPMQASTIGASAAALLEPWIIPISLFSGMAVVVTGIRSRKSCSSLVRFCSAGGALFFTGCVLFASIGLHYLLGRSVEAPGLKRFILSTATMSVTHGLIGICTIWLLLRKSFREFSLAAARDHCKGRFGMLLGLGFGCVVLYYAAHFLQVPDIRFLPPLALVLVYILFAETLEPFLSRTSAVTKAWSGLLIAYGCILAVIFGTSNADHWFRFNNRGYEYNTGIRDFQAANLFLRTADPLNAPRVGYEKCNLYGKYGGDRVFESLPYFSGRQTMEGIHYASSWAARFMAFSQTLYSKEIKTPRSYILSRLNADALPAYMNLYNLSRLILMTPEARESVESSPQFKREATFGDIAIYRYENSDGRYVDVPRRMPLLYKGDGWVEDFYRWYREGRHLDLLMVPSGYVKNEEDRVLLLTEVKNVDDLGSLRSDLLDRRGLRVDARLEHQKIEFTTNRVGLPHLVKVSYYPNWKVKGANGVYPVSPHLMMVIPRESHVVLTYGSNPWEIIGMVITGATLFILLFALTWRLLSRHSRFGPHFEIRNSKFDIRCSINRLLASAERFFAKYKPVIIGIVLLSCVGLIAGGAVNRNKPVRTYISGYRLFQSGMDLKKQGREQEAKPLFEKAIRTMSPVFDPLPVDDHQDVILCMLFTAGSHEQLGRPDAAEALYKRILVEYPFSRYVGEANVKIARIKRNQGKLQEAREHFEKAIREDRWSVWASYAKDELKKK